MGAPGQTKGAPKPRPRACRPASPAPAVWLQFGTTTIATPSATRVKTAIVDLLLILPDAMQRPAAAVVRAVWPGFRSA